MFFFLFLFFFNNFSNKIKGFKEKDDENEQSYSLLKSNCLVIFYSQWNILKTINSYIQSREKRRKKIE